MNWLKCAAKERIGIIKYVLSRCKTFKNICKHGTNTLAISFVEFLLLTDQSNLFKY
jgi:hypothetical protein